MRQPKRHRTRRWGTAIAILGLALACVGSGCGRDAERIRLGEVASMTGELASFGQSLHQGIALAVEEVNDGGGVDGIRLELITRDAQSRPETAAEAVRTLARQDRVVMVLGAAVSTNSISAGQAAQEEEIPMITPSSTHPAVTEAGPFVMRACYTDRLQGRAMARFAYQSLGLTRVAILETEGNDYSARLAEEFAAEFTGLGGEVVARTPFDRLAPDFALVLEPILAERPEAIFVPGYFDVVGRIARQARESGFRGPFLGGDGWDNLKLRDLAGDALDGSYFTNHYSLDDPNPLVAAFARNYEAAYGASPDAMAALGYDAVRLVIRALREMAREDREMLERSASSRGDDEQLRMVREVLRERLVNTAGFPGVTGTISLDRRRDAVKPVVVLQVMETGFRFIERIAAG